MSHKNLRELLAIAATGSDPRLRELALELQETFGQLEHAVRQVVRGIHWPEEGERKARIEFDLGSAIHASLTAALGAALGSRSTGSVPEPDPTRAVIAALLMSREAGSAEQAVRRADELLSACARIAPADFRH